MECKCKYYEMIAGQLVCVQCGEPSPVKPSIEDKIKASPEVKLMPPEVKREKRITKKGKRSNRK